MQPSPTRVVGRRVVAYVVDTVIQIAIVVGLWFAFTSSVPKAGHTGGIVIGNTRHGFTSSSHRVIWIALSIIAGLVIFVVIPGLRGWSPGKALVGIRLVNAEGSPPGILRAFLRYILWIVDGFPGYVLAPLVGFVTALTTKANQRVGDLAAGTFVVRAAAAGRPIGQLVPEVAGFPPGSQPTVAGGPGAAQPPPPAPPPPRA